MSALDDLFGAFDGEEVSSNDNGGKESEEKKSESSGVASSTANDAAKDTVMEDTDETKKDSPGKSTASLFTSVMSKGFSSSHATDDAKAKHAHEPKKPVEDKSGLLKKGEISTGTSHDKSVRSYSAYPKNASSLKGKQNVPPDEKPARTYPFELDPFQKQAIEYIKRNESVLVAAHTSAGKTVMAEYAIAKSLKAGQRVVYTSPIKALSNQKFRDLQEEFGDVGLMTGDITINPSATALVMTTEILRSMLYRGSELMREVAWVIYDEVHYLRDSERGVVWEESIVLLPHFVRFVFLSATIPNASQFADWIAAIHHQPCHVVYTNYRPTPLQHFVFPEGGDGLHLVVDERGKFRESNFQRAMATLQSTDVTTAAVDAVAASGNGRKRKRGSSNGKKAGGQFADLKRIVSLIMSRNLSPVIVFSFSKKDCERYALALNKEDFTDDVEKDLVTQVYTNAIGSLSEDDRKLPQVEALLPLLKRGIGIHHGGLLPILKEVTEILFSESLVKVLFATETFSIGINMPAKTVVFTNTRKWDGKDFRYVTTGEYTQMSGRAGRRGKDLKGIVIQMVDEKMEPTACKDMLYGQTETLNSSYKISYNMLLNLMRVEDVDPEYMLRASFYQFQREQDAPALVLRAEELEKEASQVSVGEPEEAQLALEFHQMDQQLLVTRKKIKGIVHKPQYIWKFLQQPGRILEVVIDGESFGWGALVSFQNNPGADTGKESDPSFTLRVLLMCARQSAEEEGDEKENESETRYRPGRIGTDDNKIIEMREFMIGHVNVEKISAVRIIMPQEVATSAGRKKVELSLRELQKRFPNNTIPLLDPVKDMGVTDAALQTLLNRAQALCDRLSEHKLATDFSESKREELLTACETKMDLEEQANVLREEARACQVIDMKDDLKKMKRVLKRLGHVDVNGVIQTKGRCACEINTSNELVVVEMIFTGVFNDLSPEQIATLLSCMIFDERAKEDDGSSGLKPFLLKPFQKLREVAKTIALAQSACGIETDADEFVQAFNPGMMEAVYAWTKGAKFGEVQKLTGSFEGTTIRTLRRLEELIRQIASATKAIGNFELMAKFEKAGEMIKRDIVFCNSLYL
ncbi:viralicidic activity 2-like 2 [Seminavis robusta]|uniref:Viralicidic activity 2-like 2 n=1 Tax=Seminavis robusta TaxID=568900 RepID=A0A9N8HDI4_9STRA|nr:viralicidic activity 2-like 2 [Seminavis robusta]|eukprot:Sro345_g122480.1 viralicidic activity 2-like 2 (1092) ;mRNA; f:43432-47405